MGQRDRRDVTRILREGLDEHLQSLATFTIPSGGVGDKPIIVHDPGDDESEGKEGDSGNDRED